MVYVKDINSNISTTWTGLKETFTKRYIAERIIKAEISLEEQNEKAESCWENLWNEIYLKGS